MAEPAVEQADIEAFGSSIRELRKRQRLTLRDLADLTGFSISFLSMVERGRSSLTLTSLYKLAKALEVDVGAFFPAAPEGHPLPHVSRATEPGEIAISGSRRTYKLLSGRAPDRVLEPLLVTIEPAEEVEEPYSHEGEEFAYVLSGQLIFVLDGVEYRLDEGDSIHFRSTVPHSVHNDTRRRVHALWVLTPRLI